MKFPVYIIIILSLGVACGIAAATVNVVKAARTPAVNIPHLLLLILLVVLALFLLVLCAGVLVYPYYKVKNGRLYSVMGVLHTSYDLKEVTELVYFKAECKLVMYFTTEKFIVIMLSEQKHEDFVKALREVNPLIDYDNKINEND